MIPTLHKYVCVVDYLASEDRVIGEYWIAKNVEGCSLGIS
jgi:hypothetical protein